MLIFARDIVLTYPDCSELMSNFDGIYLEKQYGVRTLILIKLMTIRYKHEWGREAIRVTITMSTQNVRIWLLFS